MIYFIFDKGPYSWTTTDNTDAVSGFSALCLLYARYLTDNFPSGKVKIRLKIFYAY